ncbi:MAG: alpha/beta hydrolase, partial [Verrucomicrobiota bacterium]
VLPQTAWSSQVFPGTTRDWWLYVPAQYQPDGTAALMIFQDGSNYLRPTGPWRAPVVLDNLIARGEMPVTLALFINPGHDPAKGAPKRPGSPSNRSLEYNSLGDRYARFLLEEILPAVAKTHPFSADPERRALVGSSSGGIAAFTAAWERPDQFRKVLSTIGSFVHLAGGDAYPSLIRKTERKPLRVYLEDASGDLDNPYGNWPLANQQMHAALR